MLSWGGRYSGGEVVHVKNERPFPESCCALVPEHRNPLPGLLPIFGRAAPQLGLAVQGSRQLSLAERGDQCFLGAAGIPASASFSCRSVCAKGYDIRGWEGQAQTKIRRLPSSSKGGYISAT